MARMFSGGSHDDPYWLHLEKQDDPYKAYAHLHWHTMDTNEIGKYAEFRDKKMYGDHVQVLHDHEEFWPASSQLGTLDVGTRNQIYQGFSDRKHDWLNFLEDVQDERDDKFMIDKVKDVFWGVVTPEQMAEGVEVGKKIVAHFKAKGLPYTQESVRERVQDYLLSHLDHDQQHTLAHEMDYFRNLFGHGISMNAE